MIKALEDDGRMCFAACPQHVINSGRCICHNRVSNLRKIVEVAVWIDSDYKVSKSVWVYADLSKEEITKRINEEIGTEWYSYDIQK